MKCPDNCLRLLYLTCSLVVFSIPAFGQKDVRSAWNEAFEMCGKSDVIGSKMIYFGPSNKIGPGSLWRHADDGLHLRFELSDAIPNAKVRAKLIRANNYTSCSSDHATNWDVSLGLPFINKLVDAAFFADFKRASKARISITGLAIDEIKEVPFGIALKDKSVPLEYRNDIGKPDYFIFGNGVRVKGFRVELEFEPKVGAEVHAIYKDLHFNIDGDEGAKFSIKWSGDTKVTLESIGEDIYIAGAASKWRDIAGVREGDRIIPVTVDPDALLKSERNYRKKH